MLTFLMFLMFGLPLLMVAADVAFELARPLRPSRRTVARLHVPRERRPAVRAEQPLDFLFRQG